MSHTILLYQYRKRTTGPFQKYKYHFCGIIIMKDTDKRIKVCFCCQKIQNFQASLHCFMQNLNIYNFMNFSSQNNHTEMIFICTERSFCPLSIMVKQNIVRHLVLEILIDISVSFFYDQTLSQNMLMACFNINSFLSLVFLSLYPLKKGEIMKYIKIFVHTIHLRNKRREVGGTTV